MNALLPGFTHRTAIQLLEENGYELIDVRAEGVLPWWKARCLVPLDVVRRADEWPVRRLEERGAQVILVPTGSTTTPR
jgi:hypothetical protein